MPAPVLAIDPGPVDSAWVHFNAGNPVRFSIDPNRFVLGVVEHHRDTYDGHMVVEMIASYGMPVGKDVFETCVWIGRFEQVWGEARRSRLFRRDVKMYLCNSSKAKDGNVRQALIDRYGNTREAAIGKKKSPGPLYGVSKDVWAALGVAVTWWDAKAIAESNREAAL